jgi:8-oxo-dGTP diphosphatase
VNEPEDQSVAAAIIVDRERVLLVCRRQAEGALLWTFPSGKVEQGESGEDAAVRETREEVGLEVAAVTTLGERIHPATGRRMVYVVCEVISGTAYVADTEELAEVEWCGRARVSKLVPFPFFPPVQEYLDSHLR